LNLSSLSILICKWIVRELHDPIDPNAIFWIETVKEANGTTKHLLQYSQTLPLNFNGLGWPHVSVAALEQRGRA
jgi:hypothetical protein